MQRDLVVRAQEGDHDAYAALVRGSIDRLYATARLILRADEPAEDAVQEGLTSAWLGLGKLRDPDVFDSWLQRLVVHACYRIGKRERGRRVIEISMIASTSPVTPDASTSLAMHDQLDRGFRRLSPEARAVLVLRHYLDLSDADAAAALGIPVGTMKSRLNRATSAMRAALDADERRSVGPKEPAI